MQQIFNVLPTERSTLPAIMSSGRLATLIQMGQLAQSAYREIQSIRNRRTVDSAFTISVEEDDDIYPDLHAWLLKQMPEKDQRQLYATTEQRDDYHSEIYLGDDEEPVAKEDRGTKLRYFYSGKSMQTVMLDGHPIEVWVERETDYSEEDGGRSKTRITLPLSIYFRARNREGQAVVKRMLERVAARSKRQDGVRVFMASRYGHWDRSRQIVVSRDPSTVVLAAGQMERLIADIERFIAQEQRLVQMGLPWHRGVLLSGPPGSGKTSTARAIASHFGYDIYLLTLPSITTDTDLNRLFSLVPKKCILILEDIDGGKAAISREQDSDVRVSSTGLLNALDGITTPHGLITFATTNRLDMLDEALTRSGRFDVIEEIGYLTDEQMVRLVGKMTGETIPLPALNGRKLPPSDLIEIVKRNIDDMDVARAAIVDFLRSDAESFNDWQAAA